MTLPHQASRLDQLIPSSLTQEMGEKRRNDSTTSTSNTRKRTKDRQAERVLPLGHRDVQRKCHRLGYNAQGRLLGTMDSRPLDTDKNIWEFCCGISLLRAISAMIDGKGCEEGQQSSTRSSKSTWGVLNMYKNAER